jgi:GNAT superfamily N-acetyltransferase
MSESVKNIRMPVPSDKNQILSFCENTFSWGDYIHEVWDSWENDNGLAIIEENDFAVAMCHGVQYHDEKMLWVEGIRVKKKYRKNGYATKLIMNFEKIAVESGMMYVNMLIESENTNSLNLVKKMGYHITAQWNYFSLISKKNLDDEIEFDPLQIEELKNLETIRFVESWRWIPLTKSNFEKLNSHGNILCLKKNGVVQSLGIMTESNSFDDTIILTIIFGAPDDIHKIISYVQNFSSAKNYSKIRILTTKDDLKIDNIGKKFPFYLMQKTL